MLQTSHLLAIVAYNDPISGVLGRYRCSVIVLDYLAGQMQFGKVTCDPIGPSRFLLSKALSHGKGKHTH